jgi:hypothetical protein
MLPAAHAEAREPQPRPDAAALRAFFRIAELWQLAPPEQMQLLGSPGRSTFFRWKKEPPAQLPHDTLERISYVLGIYRALQILLSDTDRADAWVRQPNASSLFGGRSALDRMLSGNVADLYVVRRYLDAELGGG